MSDWIPILLLMIGVGFTHIAMFIGGFTMGAHWRSKADD